MPSSAERSCGREPVCPPHPGSVLRHILERFEVTQDELAAAVSRSRNLINRVINERADITPCLAIRLSRALSTSPDLWLNLQATHDVFKARERLRGKLERIRPIANIAAEVGQV